MTNDLRVPEGLPADRSNAYSLPRLTMQSSMYAGISQLLQAHEYATELGRDRWDFAVEVFALRSAGATIADLRWLIYKGLANHGREFTVAGDSDRMIQKGGQFLPSNRSCLVLTDQGVRFAQELQERYSQPGNTIPFATEMDVASDQLCRGVPRASQSAGQASLPKWDCNRRELWFNGQLVKQFKLPSANQETIIVAFEEERWAPRVDDPLPPTPDIDPKRRLNDAIKSLNRRQKHQCIRFMGDGRGTGIIWEAV